MNPGKHQIQPEYYGDEQADAGLDCRTRLARPNAQARTRTGKYIFFPVQLTTSRIGQPYRLIHTLAICVTIHNIRDFTTKSPHRTGYLVFKYCAVYSPLLCKNMEYKLLVYVRTAVVALITRFSLSVQNEQAARDGVGRVRLVRPNSQARTGTGKYSFSLFS